MAKLKMGLDKSPKTCYNKDKIKERKCLNMRKAILNEKRQVVGFEPVVEEMSEQAKAQREKQSDDFTMAPMLNKEMGEINWNEKSSSGVKAIRRFFVNL